MYGREAHSGTRPSPLGRDDNLNPAFSMSTSGIPGWLPPLAALLSNVISGLTGFGDGILMQLFFALAGVVGIIPANTDKTMRKVVLYISVMPISNLPLLLYIARADLPRCAPWGVLSATSGLAALPLGNWLLLNTSTAPLATTAGVVFVLLAAVLLAAAARDAGREVWAGKRESGDVTGWERGGVNGVASMSQASCA